MARQADLFGKTFDQQLDIAAETIGDVDISPNRRIVGEVVFEPMASGVRVTARDDQHRVLWGYVGSRETVKQIHCLVATYDTLQQLIGEELDKRGASIAESPDDPLASAASALTALETTLAWLRKSLQVKKTSDATFVRARSIARIVTDANRQMTIEASSLKGMKSKSDHDVVR